MLEIERKFLLKNASFFLEPNFKKNILFIEKIKQGYIYSDQCVMRYESAFRQKGGSRGCLIIKTAKEKLVRDLYVLPIDVNETEHIIKQYCDRYIIQKYRITMQDKWQIDIFERPNSGLCLAEREFCSIYEKVNIPDYLQEYIHKDVTEMHYYYGHNIAQKLYFPNASPIRESEKLAIKIIKEIWPGDK